MPITREEVVNALAGHRPEVLRGLLEAAKVRDWGAETSRELAERIADALWWHYSTPLGYVVGSTSLDDIVDHISGRIQIDGALQQGDAWERLQTMTAMLVAAHGPVAFSDLDVKRREKLTRSWIPRSLYGSGAVGGFGARFVGLQILKFGAGPIGRWLPLIPYVGPWFLAIRKGAGLAAMLGGPVGIALSLLTVNDALGVNYEKLVPLLLGVGALGPGVVDVEEVD